MPFLVERDERVLNILERPHDRVFVVDDRFPLGALGDVVDCLRPSRIEDRHRQQRGDIAEARSAKVHAVHIEALAPEHGAKNEPREPFCGGLLPARIGGVELCLRGEQVRPPLQQRGRLSCMRRWNDSVLREGTIFAALNAWSPISTAMR